MNTADVTSKTAVLAARYLLALDVSAIKPIFQREIEYWSANLKQAYADYLHNYHAYLENSEGASILLAASLNTLADHAKSISTLLNEEAKRDFEQWLFVNNKIER